MVAIVESGFIENGAAELYYESHGTGPALLFIHSGVADSRMWQHQLHLTGYRSVVFDQRGFGGTDWVSEDYSNRSDILTVLDHLEIERAILVGCSNGGEAALQVAIVAPERVSGLVLVGTAPRGWEPDGGWVDPEVWGKAIAAFEEGDYEAVARFDAELWLAGPRRRVEDIDPDLVELFQDMDLKPTRTEAQRDPFVQTLEPPTDEQLNAVNVPTLVMVGEYDVPQLHEAAEYLAERLSDRPHVVIPDSAHLPSLEQPEVFNAELTAFLATP
jgi:pimeloyl-ACP methyl ester carboxylesterase